MKSIEITDKVPMAFPPSRDLQEAIRMWDDIGSLVKGIQLKDVRKGAVLEVKPILQELTSVAYEINPKGCTIVGYTPLGSNDDPSLIEVTATDILGGVRLSGRHIITGLVDVTVYYKQAIDGTCRVIE